MRMHSLVITQTWICNLVLDLTKLWLTSTGHVHG